MGSSKGTMSIIINIGDMQVVRRISAGLGVGHTTFFPQRNLAIVSNHHDTFITIIATVTQKKITDITVSSAADNGKFYAEEHDATGLFG